MVLKERLQLIRVLAKFWLVEKKKPLKDAHFPNARLICIEASHNMMGGTVPTLEWLQKCRDFADKHNLRIHLDAARGLIFK